MSDHARNTTGEPADASEVAEAAEIVLGWPYPPQTVLPQRWAVSSWGEACWTYMAMWAPKALSRLEARTPNVALFFHELGESLNRELQPVKHHPGPHMLSGPHIRKSIGRSALAR